MDGGRLYMFKPHRVDISVLPQACCKPCGCAAGRTVTPALLCKEGPIIHLPAGLPQPARALAASACPPSTPATSASRFVEGLFC